MVRYAARASRTVVFCAAFLAAASIPAGAAGPTVTFTPFNFTDTDTGACPFPVISHEQGTSLNIAGARRSVVVSPGTANKLVLTNADTGYTVTLHSPAPFTVTPTTLSWTGPQIWLGGPVPVETTSGSFRVETTNFTIVDDGAGRSTLDLCGLLDPTRGPVVPQSGPAPWAAPTDVLAAMSRAKTPLGLWALTEHTHAHLDVIVNGRPVPVPAGVGILEPFQTGDTPSGPFLEGVTGPLHTHTSSGVVHVESDTSSTFTLGQFFDLWSVRFSGSCLASYCNSGTASLRVYVDGAQVAGDPRAVPLNAGQVGDFASGGPEIAVVYGPAGVPAHVPSSYDFSCVDTVGC